MFIMNTQKIDNKGIISKSCKTISKNSQQKQEDEIAIFTILNNFATKSVDFTGMDDDEKREKESKLCEATKILTDGLGAQGLLQNMVATQLLGVHELQQKLLSYANRSMQYPEHCQYYLNSISKLSNVFIQQCTLLHKLQGNNQQKVMVKHLHINEGGQAIVGQINTGKKGGGE